MWCLLSLILAFLCMFSIVTSQFNLSEFAMLLGFLSYLSSMRLDVAGAKDFLILIALLRVPSFTMCSKRDTPKPLLAFGI